jgi:hypothetical protein
MYCTGKADWSGKPTVLMLCAGQRCNWYICLEQAYKTGAAAPLEQGTATLDQNTPCLNASTQTTSQGRQESLSFITTRKRWLTWPYTHTFQKSWAGQGNLSVTPHASRGLPVTFCPSAHHTHSCTDPSTLHPRLSPVAQLDTWWCQQDPDHSV